MQWTLGRRLKAGLGLLLAGTLILVPSFVYLLRIFKTGAERR